MGYMIVRLFFKLKEEASQREPIINLLKEQKNQSSITLTVNEVNLVPHIGIGWLSANYLGTYSGGNNGVSCGYCFFMAFAKW